ncbi:type II toxin-antitoxin system RelE/ParE family toxin [Bythopirellula goksoeyrii]|uniref:Plasmid stabilization system protein n=1 Tax=Bythopirellula goksoeyrii TaxID=1400387 RepID=A0A5B9QPK9_9BACT|nr:type II toxin-antitoxin system RelE/ParE family toxin [Bythopirellula goksoeyrii]QEG35913.1 Plasmid stabilization system protein [Bythopirellula goksoeyrii]
MSFRVNLTLRAETDVSEILQYIRERSPQGAATWADRFDQVLAELTESANRKPLAPENGDHEEEIRHVVFKTRVGKKYRAIFLIREDLVLVTHVRGPGQDLVPRQEMPVS